EAYSILNLWQQSYNASNIYPLTIGFYVEKLKATKNPELKKKIDDSIDSDAWENDWPKLKKVTEDFEARQAMFMKLFEAFADNPDLSYQVGGLQNYFHYFFTSFHCKMKKRRWKKRTRWSSGFSVKSSPVCSATCNHPCPASRFWQSWRPKSQTATGMATSGAPLPVGLSLC
ncbi:hypothetical protein, partial [Photorhabdus bodei]|uniref:hypothetical protein n=1 Tax=Photorhabdus bodei TaxID=2029681 RepID=UPI001E2BB45A